MVICILLDRIDFSSEQRDTQKSYLENHIRSFELN